MELKIIASVPVILLLTLVLVVNCHVSKRSISLPAGRKHFKDTHLPEDVMPVSYHLQLKPYPQKEIFQGKVWINFTCVRATDRFSLHAHHDLQIPYSEVTLKLISTNKKSNASEVQPIPIASTKREVTNHFYTVILTDKLKRGYLYQIILPFNGKISASGPFYYQTYEGLGDEGIDEWFVSSKSNPINTRYTFPCWDEPMYHATFEISIARPEDKLVFSNTKVRSTEPITGEDGWVWDHFEKTPPISTYSVMMLMANLTCIPFEDKREDKGMCIKLYARPEISSDLEEIGCLASEIVTKMEEFVGIVLPLHQLTIAIVPDNSDNFPASGLGLIMLSEKSINANNYILNLYNEIIFQWFGHITSPHWWTDISMFRMINNFITWHLASKESSRIRTEFMLKKYSDYYSLTSAVFHNTGQANRDVQIVSEGQWFINMICNAISIPTCKASFQKLLQNRKYGTFAHDDLFNAMNKQAKNDKTIPSNYSIKEMSAFWLNSNRVPVVKIHRDENTQHSAIVNQHVLIRDSPWKIDHSENLLWDIPIQYITKNNTDDESAKLAGWIPRRANSVLENIPNYNEMIIVNPKENGMFMVNYDARTWDLITSYLQTDDGKIALSSDTKAKLFHDSWNLGLAFELNMATSLEVSKFLKEENDKGLWEAAFTMFDHVGRRIDGTEAYLKFRVYSLEMLSWLEDMLDSEKFCDKEANSLRLNMWYAQKEVGDGEEIREAREEFKKWMDSENPDEGNPISDIYFCPVFSWGTLEEWEFALQRVINMPKNRTERERYYILKTLAGCPKQIEKVHRLMNIAFLETNGNFTDDDLMLILNMFTGGASTTISAFKFVSNNFNTLKSRLINKPEIWNALIYTATSQFKTISGYEAVNEFYMKHKDEFGVEIKIIEKSLKKIKRMVEWTEENIPSMVKWLDENLSPKFKEMMTEWEKNILLESSLSQDILEIDSTTESSTSL